MVATSRLKILRLLYLSKPVHNRPVYRVVRRRRVRRILEIGMGTGQRALRMIETARGHAPASEIRYTGVDLFETRPHSQGGHLSLKTAHRMLQGTGARVQLVPGDPFAALARTANSLGPVDLVLISHQLDPASLQRAWFYLPRTLHDGSLVLSEELTPSGEVVLGEISLSAVQELASPGSGRRAA